MKTRLLTLLGIFTGLFALTSTISAKPRPPLPPFPESTTLHARFDQTNFTEGAFHAEGVRLVDSWSGSAIEVGEQGFIGWAKTTTDGKQPLVLQDQGTIRFWYCPSTNAAVAQDAVLLEVATWTAKGTAPLMTMHVTPDAIGLTAGGKIVIGAPKDWAPGTWHLVALAYSLEATALYLDGQPVAKGAGVQSPRLVARGTFGLSLGSASDGTLQAPGAYDELSTFPKPASPEDIARYFRWTAPIAALGPITPEEEEADLQRSLNLRSQRLALAAQVTPFALMQQQMDSLSDLTNGPLRLTNIVWAATNDVGMRLACSTNAQYDVFRATYLYGSHFTNSVCAVVARAYPGDTITLTNEPSTNAFYIAASINDTDGDGLTDAYEMLVAKSNPDIPPAVSIFSPTNGATFASPASFTIEASVSNIIAPASIEFLVNGQSVGHSGNPYTMSLADLPCGSYSLRAIVQDPTGARGTSAVVSITVTLPETASLKCWLKADALSLTNAAAVTNWTDSSGGTNHATATGSDYQRPQFLTNQVNGLPAIKFEGGAGYSDYLHLPTFLNDQAEAFIVIKPFGSTNEPLWSLTTNTGDNVYTTNGIADSFGRQAPVNIGNPSGLASFHVYNVSARSNDWVARINGAVQASAANNSINFGTNFNLGCALYGTTWRFGRQIIAEVIIYNKALTEEQRLSVVGYLNGKYRLTTNAPGPIASISCQAPDQRTLSVTWSPATNAAYYVLTRKIGSEAVTTLAIADTRTTNYVDPIISGESVEYRVTAKNCNGQSQTSLATPHMVYVTPADEATFYVGQAMTVTLSPPQGAPSLTGEGTAAPVKVEIYANGGLFLTHTNSPWGFTVTNAVAGRWNIYTKTFDTAGNTRCSAIHGIKVINDLDSDGDGVPDSQDAFPYDFTRWQTPGTNPTDHTSPTITITEP